MVNKLFDGKKILHPLLVLLGVCYLGGVFFLASRQDYEQAQEDMLTTL